MRHQRIIGSVWALSFGGSAAFLSWELVTLAAKADSAFFGSVWWAAQAAALVVIAACAGVGIALALGYSWAPRGVRVLGPLVLLYLLAYNVFGGERAWWLSLSVLAFTVFVGASVFLAFKRTRNNAA